MPSTWRLNTSNPAKLEDFRRLFAARGMSIAQCTHHDLHEIDADPLTVVVHKASQISSDAVLVEDTSFDVEGANIGIQARWLSATLPAYIGHRARLSTLLAFRLADMVYVCEGAVTGCITRPRGPLQRGFEINPFFLPDARTTTLAEFSEDSINPRALAVNALRDGHFLATTPCIDSWDGAWQPQTSA